MFAKGQTEEKELSLTLRCPRARGIFPGFCGKTHGSMSVYQASNPTKEAGRQDYLFSNNTICLFQSATLFQDPCESEMKQQNKTKTFSSIRLVLLGFAYDDPFLCMQILN